MSPLQENPAFDLEATGNRTKGGRHRYKHGIRAAFRSAAFVSLLAIFCVYNYFVKDDVNIQDDEPNHRALEIFQVKADPTWFLALYIAGILYLFLALAIVCDEFFVPALEEMSSERHLNLSSDIAGATLMAAGGSAPELFTSLIGTFQQSEVGFGTIVGSAVFNVLFVIGVCSLLSKEVLQLTWWPLARDCSYYAIGLLVLAVFVGVVSPAKVELWESIVLFVMYLGYVLLMKFNEKLHKMITGKDLYPQNDAEVGEAQNKRASFLFPTSFRAGLLSMIRNPESWRDKARIGLVHRVAGDFDEVFQQVDKNRNGEVDRGELKDIFAKLETELSEDEMDSIMDDLDEDKNGQISKIEFKTWYLNSEKVMKAEVKKVFDRYDTNHNDKISETEFILMLEEVDPFVNEKIKKEAVMVCFKEGQDVSLEEFEEWYLHSVICNKQKEIAQKEDDDSIWARICPPENYTCLGFVKWLLLFPLVTSLTLTVPDSSRPGMGKWCYAAFLLSICWIGVYSYFMVGWTETVGNTLGIPVYIMGLTFLAAGTSVPDLLSSVIVARMGRGDMAVSSSIGSNIFDILVGLPLPWIIYTAWPNGYDVVEIGADGIWISIMILLGMILLIVATIHFQGWKLTKCLGVIMFFFYFLFLLQAILREYL
mmetsp:Transcript_30656/g.45377  ORF Transcript_30656/g.45377 Transcript_30656/m.45377 type:complete len:651 (+) Transcript_30656:40-1992(+)|eukprot:CAMPEP_0195523044 /NCGR_PEP_ID=MMETSP0794_2-20130614/21811_1 /TAXON_ID=515487 /ORGANISM="Stephanopyxis turris, Strain CCMP 815" /LENGTH=650 /DNA_ID=CAMNT_0040652949 /DNA_START=37 /DNA_END=1989 /DNA_ORIENTATION=+